MVRIFKPFISSTTSFFVLFLVVLSNSHFSFHKRAHYFANSNALYANSGTNSAVDVVDVYNLQEL